MSGARIQRPAHACFQRATSDLILGDSTVDSVLALGDEQYPCGSYANFLKGYDPSWGRLKSITHPVVGNHEVQATEAGCDTAASGYFQYFGAAAQPNGADGYYSFDVAGTGSSTATWRVIVLNANCGLVSCAAGSAQEQFLATSWRVLRLEAASWLRGINRGSPGAKDKPSRRDARVLEGSGGGPRRIDLERPRALLRAVHPAGSRRSSHARRHLRDHRRDGRS